MRLARDMKLQFTWMKAMFAIARPLTVFALENETNLARFVGVFPETQSGRHKRL